jgi:hypothetical protein
VAFDLWSLAQTLFAAVVGSELYSLPLPEVDFAFNLLVRAEAAAALHARGPQHLVPEGHPARLVLQALAEEDGAAGSSAGSSVRRHPSAPLEPQPGVLAGGGAAALAPPPIPDLISARLPHSDSLTSIGAAAEFGGGDGGGTRMQLDGPTEGGRGAGTWRDPRHSGLEEGGRGDGSGDTGAVKQPPGVSAAELPGAPPGLSLSRLGSAETAVMHPAREILGDAPRPDVSASAAAAQIGVSAAASSAGSVEGVTAAMSALGPGRFAGAAPRPPSSHLHLQLQLQREVSDGAATVGSAISVHHALLPEGRMSLSLGEAGAGVDVRPSRLSDGDAGDDAAAAESARVGTGGGQEAAVAREIFLHPNLVLHSTSLAKLLQRLSDRREGRGLPPLSPAFRDLMLRLFRLRPGFRPVCASVVLEHPWFTGLPLLVPRPLPVELPLASTIHPSLLNPGPARGLATAAAAPAPEGPPHGREPAPAAIPHGAGRAAAAPEALAPRCAGSAAGAQVGVVAEAPAGAGRGAERPSRRASSDSIGSTGPVRRWVSRSILQQQARSSAGLGAGSPKPHG